MKFGPHYLPILMYHQILPKSNPHFSKHIAVEPERFREQVQYLLDNGFQIKTVKEYFSHPEPFSQGKVAILTFDDVSSSFVEYAKPIMDELKVKGSVFPIKNMSFNEKYYNLSNDGISPLTEADLKKLYDEGFELGSHGLSHRNLHKIPFEETKKELAKVRHGLKVLLVVRFKLFVTRSVALIRTSLNSLKALGYVNGTFYSKGKSSVCWR